jgi:hypothetical protein
MRKINPVIIPCLLWFVVTSCSAERVQPEVTKEDHEKLKGTIGYLTTQVNQLHDDIIGLEYKIRNSDIERRSAEFLMQGRIDSMNKKIESMESKMGGLEVDIIRLRNR